MAPKAKSVLFGEQFQKSLTEEVKEDCALSKAASMTKRKKEKETASKGTGEKMKENF